MRFTTLAVLTGIQSSKGEFTTAGGTSREFDSTTFHLAVDMGEKSTGETIGAVTRPFKLGTSEEFQKWRKMKDQWPAGGVQVEATFELVAGSDNTSKPVLVAIKLAAPAPKV